MYARYSQMPATPPETWKQLRVKHNKECRVDPCKVQLCMRKTSTSNIYWLRINCLLQQKRGLFTPVIYSFFIWYWWGRREGGGVALQLFCSRKMLRGTGTVNFFCLPGFVMTMQNCFFGATWFQWWVTTKSPEKWLIMTLNIRIIGIKSKKVAWISLIHMKKSF